MRLPPTCERKDERRQTLTDWSSWPRASNLEDALAAGDDESSSELRASLVAARERKSRALLCHTKLRQGGEGWWPIGCSCLLAEKTYPLVLGPWARGGRPTAVDRQLALGYGAGAVRALNAGDSGSMVAFQPPDIVSVPADRGNQPWFRFRARGQRDDADRAHPRYLPGAGEMSKQPTGSS